MKTLLPYLLCAGLLCAAHTGAHAQKREGSEAKAAYTENFRLLLLDLQSLYDQGDMDSIIVLFETRCLAELKNKKLETKEFSKTRNDIRGDIFNIVSKAYLALDRPQEADLYLRKLFAIRYDEPFDDYWLSVRNARKYRYFTSPRFQLGVRGGVNATSVKLLNSYSIFNNTDPLLSDADYEKNYFSGRDFLNNNRLMGSHFAFMFEYAPSKNLILSAQAATLNMRYGYENVFLWLNNIPAANLSLFLDITNRHVSRLNYVELPVLVKYRFLGWRLQPYVMLGGYYGALLSASRQLESDEAPFIQFGNTTPQALFGQEIFSNKDIREIMMPRQVGLLGGAGLTYVLGNFRFSFAVAYKAGLNNITRRQSRFGVPELSFGFHDVPDDIRLRNLEFNLMAAFPLAHRAFKNQ